MVKVSVNIVTFNSATDIAACLTSLQSQTFKGFEIRVLDNASADATVEIVRRFNAEIITSSVNTGFSKGHNTLIRNSRPDYVLVLNPDTVLRPDFIGEMVAALEARPDAGSASGKLLRMDKTTIDSTGIVMLRNQRHLDRGAGEPDVGQFNRPEDIFGPSGAAAMYRRAALESCMLNGEFFDEDFFAYREDADLAWRLQLFGWTSLYVPTAIAQHRRVVTPERRTQLSPLINYHSVKNRFLLRINNMSGGMYCRNFWPVTLRDCMVVGYVFVREWSSVPALLYVIRHFPRLWKKRQLIQSRVRVTAAAVERWFT
jgi:GT2 family glycosyltransferase